MRQELLTGSRAVKIGLLLTVVRVTRVRDQHYSATLETIWRISATSALGICALTRESNAANERVQQSRRLAGNALASQEPVGNTL